MTDHAAVDAARTSGAISAARPETPAIGKTIRTRLAPAGSDVQVTDGPTPGSLVLGLAPAPVAGAWGPARLPAGRPAVPLFSELEFACCPNSLSIWARISGCRTLGFARDGAPPPVFWSSCGLALGGWDTPPNCASAAGPVLAIWRSVSGSPRTTIASTTMPVRVTIAAGAGEGAFVTASLDAGGCSVGAALSLPGAPGLLAVTGSRPVSPVSALPLTGGWRCPWPDQDRRFPPAILTERHLVRRRAMD
jgi:hypothetical protein